MIQLLRIMITLSISSALICSASQWDSFHKLPSDLQNSIHHWIDLAGHKKSNLHLVCKEWYERYSILYPTVSKLHVCGESQQAKLRIEFTEFLMKKYETNESGEKRTIADIVALFQPVFPLINVRQQWQLSSIQKSCFRDDLNELFEEIKTPALSKDLLQYKDPLVHDLRDPSVLVGALAIAIERAHLDCFALILSYCDGWFIKDNKEAESGVAYFMSPQVINCLLAAVRRSSDIRGRLRELILDFHLDFNNLFNRDEFLS